MRAAKARRKRAAILCLRFCCDVSGGGVGWFWAKQKGDTEVFKLELDLSIAEG